MDLKSKAIYIADGDHVIVNVDWTSFYPTIVVREKIGIENIYIFRNQSDLPGYIEDRKMQRKICEGKVMYIDTQCESFMSITQKELLAIRKEHKECGETDAADAVKLLSNATYGIMGMQSNHNLLGDINGASLTTYFGRCW